MNGRIRDNPAPYPVSLACVAALHVYAFFSPNHRLSNIGGTAALLPRGEDPLRGHCHYVRLSLLAALRRGTQENPPIEKGLEFPSLPIGQARLGLLLGSVVPGEG